MRNTDHTPNPAQNPTRFDIHLRAARVAFGGADIFHDLDLTLQAGSFTCLLGPSGVGKSTLLRYFADLVEGDVSGTITCSDNLPLTGRVAYMDPLNRLRLQELAARVLRGKTVLLVTHDPLEALRLGDDVHVLAGAPAKLQNAITPKGQSPRNIADPEILAQQAELLRQLGAENSDMAEIPS